MNKIFAIGDIHGRFDLTQSLLEKIWADAPHGRNVLIFLGDYVDRGPDSKGVLDQLIGLKGRCHLVPLMGNHEEMMLEARKGRDNFRFWMQCGGGKTLDSYGCGRNMDLVPPEHWAFLIPSRKIV